MHTSLPVSLPRLLSYCKNMRGAKVLIIGDLMLDAYLIGDAHRISPEAPVPVIAVEEERLLLGGAGNVARNIKSLGGEPTLISVAGKDADANRLLALCDQENIRIRLIQDAERRTTTKTRILARQQQMLRIDREQSAPLGKTAVTALLSELATHAEEHNVLIVSDYGKGVIGKTLMDGIRKLQADRPGQDFKFLVDPKYPNFNLYQGAYILTPNAKETGEAAAMVPHAPEDVKTAGRIILRTLGCRHLLSTLGARGMALFENSETVIHISTAARSVFDVTGAGDTVMAALGLSLAAGTPLLESCLIANAAAGIVVGKVGAETASQEELTHALARPDAIKPEIW